MSTLWMSIVVLTISLTLPQQTECFLFTTNTLNAVSVPDGKVSTTPYLGDIDVSKQVSSDGTKEINISVTPSDVQLEVKKLDVPIPLAANRREQFDPYAAVDVNWSPNSQFIAYIWKNPISQETELRLANADGKTLKEIPLTSSSDLSVQIDSWSADSQFFTVLIQRNEDFQSPIAQITPRFFAAPDLKEVTPPGLAPIPLNSWQWNDGYWQVYCTYWANTGHQAAFTTRINDDTNVIIATPPSSAVNSYREPVFVRAADWNDWYVLWSPDSQKIAVSHNAWKKQGEDKFLGSRQLELYYADGSRQASLGENNPVAQFHADGGEVIPWAWSADSSTLFYVRDTPSDKDESDVVGYKITTGEKTVILSFPTSGTYVVIYPSPDGRSVFVDINDNDKESFYLLSPTGKQLWKQTFEPDFMIEYRQRSVWSSQNSYFGILHGYNLEVYDSDGKQIMTQKNDAEVGFVGYIGWTDCG